MAIDAPMPKTAPAAAPMSSAGVKTPPDPPEPSDEDVATILARSRGSRTAGAIVAASTSRTPS